LFRTVTSDVSAVSSFVANSTSPCNTFPPPSLKLRTSGFPQYGFKLEFNHNLKGRVPVQSLGEGRFIWDLNQGGDQAGPI